MRAKLCSHHNNVLKSGGGEDQEDVSKENHKKLLRKRKRTTMSALRTLGGGKENKYLKGLTNEGKRFVDEHLRRIQNEERKDIRNSWEKCYREICELKCKTKLKCKQNEKNDKENEWYGRKKNLEIYYLLPVESLIRARPPHYGVPLPHKFLGSTGWQLAPREIEVLFWCRS
jgi:hypothetical protein